MVASLTRLMLVIRGQVRSRARLEAENLALRQQLSVLYRRSPGDPVALLVRKPPGKEAWIGAGTDSSQQSVGEMTCPHDSYTPQTGWRMADDFDSNLGPAHTTYKSSR
jgi:hypothetical protein